LEQTEETNTKRSFEPVSTRKAAKAKKARKKEEPKPIDPERLYTAIRYIKEHPER
jgi:hypothetical protein